MEIPLSSPDITELEKEKILEVLNTPHLSLGPKLREFEQKFAAYIGSKYAIAVNSGTSGLHLCMRALDTQEGDIVITTPFSFIASANCILFERATHVFVDIDEKTLNIDPNRIEQKIRTLNKKNSKLKTILPVHIFGRPCDMDDIMGLACPNGLKVIEDACESIGAEYLTITSKVKTQNSKLPKTSYSQIGKNQETNGLQNTKKRKGSPCKKIWQKVGTFGDCGVFAFYPNKQITMGEGGIIATDNENINQLCRSMRNQGRSENDDWLKHDRLGYNYRASDINCALGLAQLERIDEILAKRERVADLYNMRLKIIEEVVIPHFEKNKKISWFVYVVRLADKYSKEDRDLVLNKMKEKHIGCSNYFPPIHLQPFYRNIFGYKKGDFPITEKVSERTIALPFYNNLKEDQINYVCENLIEIIRSLRS